RLQRKVDITAVQVERTQFLQVSGQALTGILVIALDEGPEMRRPELEALQYFIIRINRVADDIDIADARRLALIDIDLQLNTVTRQGYDFAIDAGAVTALGHVLALQLGRNALKRGTTKHFALRQ